MCEEEQEEHCQSPTEWSPAGDWCACDWPNCQKQTPWGQYEDLMSCSGICAHSTALCSLIGICQRTPESAAPTLAPCSLHGWEQVHTEHTWQMWKSLEMSWRMLWCLHHLPAWVVWQWISDGLWRNIFGGSHRYPCVGQQYLYCCYIPWLNHQSRCQILHWCSGSGFLQEQDNDRLMCPEWTDSF